MKGVPSLDSILAELLETAPREFKLALAAGVEMEAKSEQTPDGRFVFTIATVPLVGIADMGDGRVILCTRERTTCTK